jgi:cytochrome c oxidase subunit 2
VGQQLHRRVPGTVRKAALVIAMGTLVLVSGCSATTQHEWKNLAMPDPATQQGDHIFMLWRYAWVAAMVTGVIVWGLIFWVVVRYRRRSDDEVPIQTRYNLPLEIFYTVAPIIMVVVFFAHTVKAQDYVLQDTKQDHTIDVVGQQWSWTFNYVDEDVVGGKNVYTSGAGGTVPTLVLPVGETTQFNLYSPDVQHDFGIPGFLMRMDVVPGRVNHFEVTPKTTGTFAGHCYELCGVYHSRMLFNVRVVSPEEYDAYLQDLQAKGLESDEPLLGGVNAYEQAGLNDEQGSESGASSQ